MKKYLVKLLDGLKDYELFGRKGLLITGISDDSRKVKKGSLFIAIKGLNVDAHKYIPEAISSGAVVVVGEKKPFKSWLDKITYVKVPGSRQALGLLASAWHNYPSKKLKIIGVTGTDGKTTTANIIYWVLNKSGKKTGLVSTVSAKVGRLEYDTGLHVTNPEPIQLQKFLSEMVKKNCEYAVLEVTSHGLDQERVAGIDFAIAVLTNITHEHIDYHKTYARYLKTKAILFKKSKTAILNKEDLSYKRIKKLLDPKTKLLSYSSKTLKGNIKKAVDKRFPEPYNKFNAAASVAVAQELGIKDLKIIKAIRTFPKIPGRMEEIKNNKGVKIFVDFAHTPNALKNALQALKDSKKKGTRLIAVFGCAGERDIEKRSIMPRISSRLADISVFTAEDPRSEKINHILDEMAKTAIAERAIEFSSKDPSNIQNRNKNFFVRVPERGEAIAFAIQKLAKKEDIVVIYGKGHEKSMAYNGIEYPWSDHKAVKIALRGGVKKIERK
ncbi:MAG: UDP-N-acetylmuramoyl-L-alanyl-D-glutamate--2,6-diaminopimelate ligase [Microgenomates group bacterium]